MKNRSSRILKGAALGAATGGLVGGAAGFAASAEADNNFFPFALAIGSVCGAVVGSIFAGWSSPPPKIKDSVKENISSAQKLSMLQTVSLFKNIKQPSSPVVCAKENNDEEKYFDDIRDSWESTGITLIT